MLSRSRSRSSLGDSPQNWSLVSPKKPKKADGSAEQLNFNNMDDDMQAVTKWFNENKHRIGDYRRFICRDGLADLTMSKDISVAEANPDYSL